MRRLLFMIYLLTYMLVLGQTSEDIKHFLERDDLKTAISVLGEKELLNSLSLVTYDDTIVGGGGEFGSTIWYSLQSGSKIPVFYRSFTGNLNHPIASNKLRAFAWMIMMYEGIDPTENYIIFKNSKHKIIFDYLCFKEELTGMALPMISCVKSPTDGYDDLVKEMEQWMCLVRKYGLDYIRQHHVAPLTTISYEIVAKDEIFPRLEKDQMGETKLALGTRVEYDEMGQSRVLLHNNELVESHDTIVDGINYKIGIRDDIIVFISTSDEKFSINNYRIGTPVPKDLLDRELRYTPGWGYYIEMGSGWYACFDFTKKPTEKTPIQFFFKYVF